MIRVIKKKDLVYLSEEPRREFDLGRTELLFTFPELELSDRIRANLRPWKYLGIKTTDYYKLSLLTELPGLIEWKGVTELRRVSEREHERRVSEVLGALRILGRSWENKTLDYEILYTIDSENYLTDLVGVDNLRAANKFLGLSSAEKEVLRKISILPTTYKKLELAREGLTTDSAVSLLPEWIQEHLRYMGESKEVGNREEPEFCRPDETIGPEYPDLASEVYKEFRLGEELLDGASGVKERLKEIYIRCGFPDRTPAAKDLQEWFSLSPCISGGKRGQRIDLRKL